MTRRLPFTLVPGVRETPLDYLSRLSFRNGRDGVRRICSDFGIRCTAVAAGDPGAIAVLAALGGAATANLQREALLPLPGRRIRYRDQEFQASMISRYRVRFCPACFLDDISRGAGRLEARSWRRGEWLLRDIHACPSHDVALVDLGSQPDPKVPDYSKALASTKLSDVSRAAKFPLKATGMELYLLVRIGALSDSAGNVPFLDRLPLHACIRMSEVLGAVARDGPDASMTKVATTDLRDRQQLGFEIASGAEPAIRHLLGELLAKRRRGSGDLGPQALLGRLYLWLAHPSLDKALLPVREIVEDFCFDRLAIGPGDAIAPFGRHVVTRRMHSVRSASIEFEVHPLTLRKALIEKGVLSEVSAGWSDDLTTFDAERHEGMLSDIATCLDLQQAAERLKVSDSLLLTLVRDGLIVPFFGGRDGALRNYGFRHFDLDEFVERLLPGKAAVLSDGEALRPVLQAARAASCSVSVIVGMLRDNRLLNVGRQIDGTGLPSVLVDPDEIKTLQEKPSAGLLHPAEVRELTGLPLHVVRALVRVGLLAGVIDTNRSTGAKRLMVTRESFERFRAAHVTLVELAREYDVSPRLLWNRLSEERIGAAVDHRHVGAVMYRKSDLPDRDRLNLVAWPSGLRRPRA